MTKKRTITELERLRDTVRDDFRLGFIKPRIAHKLIKGYDKKIEEVRNRSVKRKIQRRFTSQ